MRPAPILIYALLLAACGDDEAPQPAPAALQVPATPEDALDWVREAAEDDSTLRKRLAAWPMDREDFADSEETQTVITWRLRLALQDGDVETALRRQHMLADAFDGDGVSPEGRTLSARAIVGAIFDESLYQARVRIEGARPDREAAVRALDVARDTMDEGDERAARRIQETVAWIDLAHVRDLATPLHLARPIESGSRVVVLADDFALGESVFISVLERWQRDGKNAGIRVEVVPVMTGQVRMGIRRIPAESAQTERASLAARCNKAGLALDPGFVRAASLEAIGLGPQETAILVANADGRIIGRLSGTNIDPRELDVVVERLISR